MVLGGVGFYIWFQGWERSSFGWVGFRVELCGVVVVGGMWWWAGCAGGGGRVSVGGNLVDSGGVVEVQQVGGQWWKGEGRGWGGGRGGWIFGESEEVKREKITDQWEGVFFGKIRKFCVMFNNFVF